eukprot:225127_1
MFLFNINSINLLHITLLKTIMLFALITIAQLIFQTECQEAPGDVCVLGAVNNFANMNGEYELEGTHNGFPYYKKDECSTQYIYAYYYPPDDFHYYTFYSELTIEYPESDPSLPECGAEGQDWNVTPSDPTQCIGGWVVYISSLLNSTYNETDITVQSGECASDIECDTENDVSDSSDSSDSNDNAYALFEVENNDIGDNEQMNKVIIDINSELFVVALCFIAGSVTICNICYFWNRK